MTSHAPPTLPAWPGLQRLLDVLRPKTPGVDVVERTPPHTGAAPATHTSAHGVTARQERFELKYWMPESLARELLRRAAPFLMQDPKAAKVSGGPTQTINALYLDTPGFEWARSHMEKSPDRMKLRVRAYGDPPSGMAFFEMKRKVKAITEKRRARVPLGMVPTLLDGTQSVTLPVESPEQRRNLELFLHHMILGRALPCVLIRYTREAYVAPDPLEDVRVTLDRNVITQAMQGPSLVGHARAWVPVLAPLPCNGNDAPVLVELKFRGAAPFWMEPLVQTLGLCRSGNSKYLGAVLATASSLAARPAWLLAGLAGG